MSSRVHRAFSAAKTASVGIEFAVAVFIGWGAGWWLDGKLGTDPWLMLVGLGYGVAAGYRGLYRAGQAARAAAKGES